MDANAYPLSKLLNAEIRYVVPRFQRQYVWKPDKNLEPLWSEIVEMTVEDLQGQPRKSDSFLGAIITRPVRQQGLETPQKELIDGQQRMTTMQVMLHAIGHAAEAHGAQEVVRSTRQMTHNALGMGEPAQFKVWPTDADREAFVAVMGTAERSAFNQAFAPSKVVGRGRRSAPEDDRPLVARAYEFVATGVDELLSSQEPAVAAVPAAVRLSRLVFVILNRLKVVLIDLADTDDPLVIFESLNGRGTKLLASDLIRNFVVREAGADEEGKRLYERYWRPFDAETFIDPDDKKRRKPKPYWRSTRRRREAPRIDQFVADFLQCYDGREVRHTDTFADFQQWWRGQSTVHRKTPEDLLKEVRHYANVYRELVDPPAGWGEDEALTSLPDFCRGLWMMDTSVVYPLLLFLFGECRDNGWLEEADVPGMLRDLESYLVRRHVCGLTKKKYNWVFPRIVKGLREHLHVNPAAGRRVTRVALRQVMLAFGREASDGAAVRWPDDAEFQRAWMDNPLYQFKPTSYAQLALTRLDQASRQHAESVEFRYDKLTIEHVLPQKWTTHYPLPPGAPDGTYAGVPETAVAARNRLLDTIGNLTLLSGKLNSAMKNGEFAVKRVALTEQTSVQLNAYFQAPRDTWDELAIRSRSEQLFAMALQIWPYPRGADEGGDPIVPVRAAPPPADRAKPPPSGAALPSVSEPKGGLQNPSPIGVPAVSAARTDVPTVYKAGNYQAIVTALNGLGVDQMHSYDDIVPAVRKAMGEERWAAFQNKQRTDGLPINPAADRVIQNVQTIARADYGKKLRNTHFEVRYDGRRRTAGLFRL